MEEAIGVRLPEVRRHQVLPDHLRDDRSRTPFERCGQLLDRHAFPESRLQERTIVLGPRQAGVRRSADLEVLLAPLLDGLPGLFGMLDEFENREQSPDHGRADPDDSG